jgi:type I site-specific restriction endonuclease
MFGLEYPRRDGAWKSRSTPFPVQCARMAGTAITYSRDWYTASVPTGQSGTGKGTVRGCTSSGRATGTDVRALEIVFFMRTVKSRSLFEQMKGRGARVVTETELKQVTPDASAKDRFVIVDAIGIDPNERQKPLERKRNVSLEKLLELVAFGNRETDALSSIASRLARLDRQLTQEDREELKRITGNQTIASIASDIVRALNPDEHLKAAQKSS